MTYGSQRGERVLRNGEFCARRLSQAPLYLLSLSRSYQEHPLGDLDSQSTAQAWRGLSACLWALWISCFILDSPNHKSQPVLVPTSPASGASPLFLQAWWLNTQFH